METKSGERQPMGWLELMAEFKTTAEATFGRPMPGEFWHHVRAARKERLLAMRSIIDAKLERLEQQEKQAEERTVTRIPVQ
jgi:hypothetical protein